MSPEDGNVLHEKAYPRIRKLRIYHVLSHLEY